MTRSLSAASLRLINPTLPSTLKLSQRYKKEKSIPNLTIITSGKEGVGKTWCSVHLAHAIGLMGKKTLFVDGDFGHTNVNTHLGLTPDVDLTNLLKGKTTLEECLYKKESPGSFDILPGASGSADFARLSPARRALLKATITSMAYHYQNVFLDLSAGTGQTITQYIPLASRLILITTPDPTSLADTYALLKVVHKNFPWIELSIIVNQANSKPEAEKAFHTLSQACETFLNISPTFLGSVLDEPEIYQALDCKKILEQYAPQSKAWRDIQRISRKFFSLKSQRKNSISA